jgi:hypothetical protein
MVSIGPVEISIWSPNSKRSSKAIREPRDANSTAINGTHREGTHSRCRIRTRSPLPMLQHILGMCLHEQRDRPPPPGGESEGGIKESKRSFIALKMTYDRGAQQSNEQRRAAVKYYTKINVAIAGTLFTNT